MTIKAAIVHVNGVIEMVQLADQYEAINKVVGGYFQVVESETGETSFWMHEEGKLIGLDANPTATRLLWDLNPAFRQRDILVGTVLVTGGADDEGNTLGLSDEAELALMMA